jgi:tRNA threonylcarbamoyladenosine biosynthesis protein TsaE
LKLPDPEATERFGRALGHALGQALAEPTQAGLAIWLEGELGAGKTSMARAILRGLGYTGRVPSPSYTLVEPYELGRGRLYHVDLYRLQAPDEADVLGLAELPGSGELLLMEWPERGGDRLAPPDLRLRLAVEADGRELVVLAAEQLPRHLADWLDVRAPV